MADVLDVVLDVAEVIPALRAIELCGQPSSGGGGGGLAQKKKVGNTPNVPLPPQWGGGGAGARPINNPQVGNL